MHFGIRENAMGAILNGMALHRGLIPYGATFLVFSDCMRPPMRLAAMNRMNGLPAIVLFTHDSLEWAKTAPRISRSSSSWAYARIPGMTVIRPADANETVAAWRIAIARRDGPTSLVLTRQELPVLDLALYPMIPEAVYFGGYILAEAPPGKTSSVRRSPWN